MRHEVRLQAAHGVDYIKLYVGLTPNLVEAVIHEAHHNGIKVIGHLYLTSGLLLQILVSMLLHMGFQ